LSLLSIKFDSNFFVFFQASFDNPTTTSIPSPMDKGYYRQVPYRFFTSESETDTCKLEKLTNLFPAMRATIELGKFNCESLFRCCYVFFEELFKITHLSRTIDRLSRIYTVLTALDIRDDTLHLFLGPYHLSLGPALFAALHFKNASSALLVASRSTGSTGTDNHRRKRRRDVVLRRFRRAVRKLTLVKSIIDQLQPASVLTPYNQYELYKHGIYDLVLAGRIQDSQSMFASENFLEQIGHADPMQQSGERNPLLASNFIKINNLLNLLSSSTPQQQQQQSISQPLTLETSATKATGKMIPIKSNESVPHVTKGNEPDASINSAEICCSHHHPTSPFIMYPVPRAPSPQPSQIFSNGSRSRHSSPANHLRTPSVLSRQSTVGTSDNQFCSIGWVE
jgi:hypothetical protein